MSTVFGDRLKTYRLSKGYSQEQLAEYLGTTKQVISRYENSQRSPKITIVSEYANALGLPLSYFLGEDDYPAPNVTDDVVSFPIIGDIAAGYDHVAVEDWEAEKVDIPRKYLKGRPAADYFALRVKGDSMYPMYQEGDIVLVLKQTTMNRSGQIGVVVYDDDQATLKKIEYVMGEDWMKLIPVNPNFPPIMVTNEKLEHCKVLGIPRLLIREVEE